MTEENNNETTNTQVYELGYHILPTVTADDLEGEIAKIRSAIEARGGSFITEGTPEMTTLAFPMYVNNGGKKAKYETAYFGWIKFEMEHAQAVALEKDDIKPNAQILRYILIKTTREETRAQLQTEQNTILREVKTTGTIEKKEVVEEGGEVSEEQVAEAIEEMVGEEKKEEKETKE